MLVRHGFVEFVRRAGLASLVTRDAPTAGARTSVAERIRLVLQDLGPSFIKLGQILSTRSDLLPPTLVEELQKLQEQASPIPFEELRADVEAHLGAPVEEVFETFNETPVASASVAQVHCATLVRDEQSHKVAVKIQRPGIATTIERDIDLLHWLAQAVESSMPELRAFSPRALVREFDRGIVSELDFNREAENADRFTDNFLGSADVRFPSIYRETSSRSILTMEFIEGHRIDDAIARGVDAKVIATKAVGLTVKQIFEDGFFHADPHPGNIIITGSIDNPVIGLIDLGLVGRLSPKLRDRTIDLMSAALARDVPALADAVRALSPSRRPMDQAAFESDIAELSDRYLGKRLNSISLGGLITDLMSTARRYQLEFPPDFLMVGKALVTIEGIGKRIYPELDVLEEARPYFFSLARQRYDPERLGRDLIRGMSRMGGAAKDLPLQVSDILEELRQSKLMLRVREPQLGDALERLGRRIFGGLIAAAWILSAALLLVNDRTWLAAAALVSGLGYAVLQAFGLILRNRLRRD